MYFRIPSTFYSIKITALPRNLNFYKRCITNSAEILASLVKFFESHKNKMKYLRSNPNSFSEQLKWKWGRKNALQCVQIGGWKAMLLKYQISGAQYTRCYSESNCSYRDAWLNFQIWIPSHYRQSGGWLEKKNEHINALQWTHKYLKMQHSSNNCILSTV